jgi:flagellar L-ring protein precursor FlgH
MNLARNILVIISLILLASCTTLDRLKRVGKSPDFAKLEVPIDEEQLSPAEKEEVKKAHVRKTNSLWQPGATSFFRDNRAWRVGDILRVKVKISDKATLNNSTKQKRNATNDSTVNGFFGKKRAILATIGMDKDLTSFVDIAGKRDTQGSGDISRKEIVETQVAAMVRQVMTNGNLVIEGHQEIRVNSELREVKVAGIIRTKDIASDNSISSDQIAEARISYGGRGVVSDMQDPRVGSQIADILSPF